MKNEELKVKLPKKMIQDLELYAKVCDVSVEGFLEDLLSNYMEEQAEVYDSYSRKAFEEAKGNCWYWE